MYLYNSEYNIKINKDVVSLSFPVGKLAKQEERSRISQTSNNSYALKYRKDKTDHYLSLINL